MALDDVRQNTTCKLASDGIEALTKLKSNPSYIPDYIFLDINMPKMNGLQCLPEIRKMEHLRDAKVIMYSTTSDEDIRLKTRQLGADDFLVKAPRLSLLINDLNRILEKGEL